jgi:uncharacterized protein
MVEKGLYKGERIDYNLFTKIIDKIIKQRIINERTEIPLNLIFHGGEPLLIGKEKFRKFLNYVYTQMKENKVLYTLGMQTNATLLDDEYLQMFEEFGVNIGLSFDGIADANKQRTDIKQQIFEKKFKTIEKHNINYGFLLVVGKHNINKYKKSSIYLKNLKQRGHKANYAEDIFNFDNEKSIEISGKEFFDKVMKVELESFIQNGEFYEDHTQQLFKRTITDIVTIHDNDAQLGCGTKFCGAAISMIGVNPDGTSHYCDRYKKEYDETFVMHNLDYDFLGIHQLKEAVNYNLIRDKVVRQTGCDTCFAQYICEGGCMAMYYSKHGEYGLDKNLVCGQQQNFYLYVLENFDRIVKTMVKYEYVVDSIDNIYKVKDNMKEHLNEIDVEAVIDKNNNKRLKFKRG